MFSIPIEIIRKISSQLIIFFSLLSSKNFCILKTYTRKELITKDPPTTELNTTIYKFKLLVFS